MKSFTVVSSLTGCFHTPVKDTAVYQLTCQLRNLITECAIVLTDKGHNVYSQCISGYGPAVCSDDITCADFSKLKFLWILNLAFQLTMVTLIYCLHPEYCF